MAQFKLRIPIGLVVNSDVARQFGLRIAEDPILTKMKNDAALGSPGDHNLISDGSSNDSDGNMFVFIALKNNLPRERITEMQVYRRGTAAGGWSRPDALIHTRAVREYYEIKPMSAPGLTAGAEKIPNINNFMNHFGFPYVAGIAYLQSGTEQVQILEDNAVFQAELRSLQSMLGVRQIRLFLQWEKPTNGLIVYNVMVVIDTNDQNTNNFPTDEVARAVVKLAIQSAIPGVMLGVSATRALAAIMAKLRDQLDQLKRNTDLSRGLHERLLRESTMTTAQKLEVGIGLLNPLTTIPTIVNVAVNPAMRNVVGAGVQAFNSAKAGLDIWKPVIDNIAACEAALQAGNGALALGRLAAAQASFTRASTLLTAFQNGTEAAGMKAQLAIGVTAAVAIVAAVAVYSLVGVAAVGTATTTGTAAGAAANGATVTGASTGVRVATTFFRVGVQDIIMAETPAAFEHGVLECLDDAPRAMARALGN